MALPAEPSHTVARVREGPGPYRRKVRAGPSEQTYTFRGRSVLTVCKGISPTRCGNAPGTLTVPSPNRF
jgi:hypothetical protein